MNFHSVNDDQVKTDQIKIVLHATMCTIKMEIKSNTINFISCFLWNGIRQHFKSD